MLVTKAGITVTHQTRANFVKKPPVWRLFSTNHGPGSRAHKIIAPRVLPHSTGEVTFETSAPDAHTASQRLALVLRAGQTPMRKLSLRVPESTERPERSRSTLTDEVAAISDTDSALTSRDWMIGSTCELSKPPRPSFLPKGGAVRYQVDLRRCSVSTLDDSRRVPAGQTKGLLGSGRRHNA